MNFCFYTSLIIRHNQIRRHISSIRTWDEIITLKSLCDKDVVKRIFEKYFDNLEEAFQGNVVNLYTYIENYISVKCSIEMNDALKELKDNNITYMIARVYDIY